MGGASVLTRARPFRSSPSRGCQDRGNPVARPRTYKTEAVVLKQSPMGEADRILTFYTQDMGKVRAVAKGVRRPKSKLTGHLEPLCHVSISVSHGRNLDLVTEAQVIQPFKGLREDLHRISQGIYLAELVDSFSVEHSSNSSVYRLLLVALGCLETMRERDLLLPHFELHLLEHSGYRPELFRCVECRATLEPGDHTFSAARGGIVCPDCRVASGESIVPLSLSAMKVLRFLIRDEEYARVGGLKVNSKTLRDIERLLRTYIRFLVERELKSVEFMDLVSSGAKR